MAEPAQTVKMGNFGYTTDLLNRTVLISGSVTQADVGKALTQDTTAPNTYKLAGDNDVIFGRLELLEARTNEGTLVGNAKLYLMGVKLPIKAASGVAVGSFVIGAGAGEVKPQVADATTIRPSRLYVVAIAAGYATVYSL